jgi:hypothetical protein
MNHLFAAAIIAIAGSGLMSQDQAQTHMQRFIAAQPQLEKYLDALQPKEAIELLEGMIPDTIPDVGKGSEDPEVLRAGIVEISALQIMFVYLGRAQVLSGEVEKAIDSLKKAKDMADLKATGTEDLINLQIQGMTQTMEQSKARLKEIENVLAKKKDLESKNKLKMNKLDREQLQAITKDMPNLENQTKICNEALEKLPAVIQQMNEAISVEKANAEKFAPAIADLEDSLKKEQELISSDFGGDKAKYVSSAVNAKGILEKQKTMQDKASFLNRLLVLDPVNKDVQKQLALLIGNN